MVSLEVSTLDESAAIGVRSHIHATYRTKPASWPMAQ